MNVDMNDENKQILKIKFPVNVKGYCAMVQHENNYKTAGNRKPTRTKW